MDVPRFNSIDPLAEDYYSISPYAYVANNLLRMIDLTGMSLKDTIITLETVEISAIAPKRNPISGFWGNVGYYWNGGNYDGFMYNKQDDAIVYRPITGTPPLPSRVPSWKSIKDALKALNTLGKVRGQVRNVKDVMSVLGKTISSQR